MKEKRKILDIVSIILSIIAIVVVFILSNTYTCAATKNNVDNFSSASSYYKEVGKLSKKINIGSDDFINVNIKKDSVTDNDGNKIKVDRDIKSALSKSSVNDAEDYLSEESHYSVISKGKKSLKIIDNFKTKSLFVLNCKSNLPKLVNAEKIIHFNDKYMITFKSEKDTKEAYDLLYNNGYDVNYNSIGRISNTGKGKLTSSSLSWGTKKMGLDKLKSKLYKGNYRKRVKVAIIDSGIDYNNSILKDRIEDKVNYSYEDTIEDLNGHGTHVCGIITDGTNDNIRFSDVKIANDDGTFIISSLMFALQYCIDNNVDIINMSIVIGTEDNESISDLLKSAYNKNIVMCCAAGNNNDGNTNGSDTIEYPAKSKYTIAVGAVDDNYNVASFSAIGKELDFCAPGVDVYSTYPNNNFSYLSGTSMAAPSLAACAANIESCYNNKKLSKNDIVDIIKKNALDSGDKGYDIHSGYGFPDFSMFDPSNPEKDTGIGRIKCAHNFHLKDYLLATCTHCGRWRYVCSKCGAYKYEDNKEDPASGHSFMLIKSSKATYFKDGYKKYECAFCDKRKTVKIKKLVLSAPSIKSTKSKSKSITLRWSSVKDASGYQIRYAIGNGKYTYINAHNKHSYTITKLKAKKYKIYTRAYIISKNKKQKAYSKWSSVKYITVKK